MHINKTDKRARIESEESRNPVIEEGEGGEWNVTAGCENERMKKKRAENEMF